MRRLSIAVAVLSLAVSLSSFAKTGREQVPLRNWHVNPEFVATTHLAGTPLHFVAITPCRLVDTRNADGPFGGPIFAAGATRSYAIPAAATAGGCDSVPAAAAYSLNFAIVNYTGRAAVKAYATGTTPPLTSILNYGSGLPVSNGAVVPASVSGSIDVNVSITATPGPTHLIIDINGYFETGVVTGLTPGTGISITGTNNLTVGITPNSIGTAQINSAEVQRRVTGTCVSAMTAIAADGTVTCASASASGPVLPKLFKTDGSYVVPAGVTVLLIEAWGGGGGASATGGGGGAGYIRGYLTVTPADSLTIHVGTGGLGNAAGDGFDGYDTTITGSAGTLLTAGKGSHGSANWGIGGSVTGAVVAIQSQIGGGNGCCVIPDGGGSGLSGSTIGDGGTAPGGNGYDGLVIITPAS